MWYALIRLGFSCIAMACLASAAQAAPLIRDAEIEYTLKQYAAPILRANRLVPEHVHIYIVQDDSLNAFVAGGANIFLHTGIIMARTTPDMLLGVMAHEAGHIAGGHNIRLRQQMERAQIMSVLATLVGAAAMAGGAATGTRGAADAGRAISSAGNQVALRALLAYRRSEEDAADQSALRYLEATGQSARGMIKTFEKFASQEMFNGRNADPYATTHPQARARIGAITPKAEASRYFNAKDDPALLQRHKMMQAKLAGYLEHPRSFARRYKDKNSLEARYALATSAVVSADTASALRQLDGLIKSQPNNPYFWELRGEALLKARRAQEAVDSLGKALQLSGGARLIRVSYANALFALGNVNGAIEHFEKGLADERASSLGFIQLSRAYAQAGREGEAALATARARLLEGNLPAAKSFAQRAKASLPHGSAKWLQAEDILQIRG